MNINIFVICVICLLLTSCQSFLKVAEEPTYQEIFSFGNEAKKIYNLQLVGFGGGTNKGREIFNLTFMGNQTPDLDEARAIFYDLSTRFLERINSNEKLRALTLDNIFTIANLNISIMFPKVQDFVTGVGNAFAFDRDPLQFIYYFTYNPESKKSKITYKEPYEQLKSIVEHQRGLSPPSH